MKSKKNEALIRKIEKYYKENIGRSLYFYPLAVLYYEQNEKDKAYQILLEGLQHYPRYVLALVKIAEILIEDNKYEAALAYLETATSIQKYNTKALRYLALTYEKLSRYEDALEVYKKILSIDYNDENAKSKIVELAPMVKPDVDNIDSLIEETEKNLEADEKSSNGSESLIEEKISDPDDLLKNDVAQEVNIENIPEIDLEDESSANSEQEEEPASVTLARLYEKQGYIDDAIEVYKKLLEKEPDNMEVQEALTRLQNAKTEK